MVIAFVATAILAGVDPAFAALIKPLLDRAFVEQNPTYIRWIPVYIIGLFLLRGLSSFVSIFGMAWVARRVVKDMRGRVFNKLLDLPSRRSEEHTSELQSLMRISYAVFCLKKKIYNSQHTIINDTTSTNYKRLTI